MLEFDPSSREHNLLMAKLTDQMERYDEMFGHMEAVIQLSSSSSPSQPSTSSSSSSKEISMEERNFFLVASQRKVDSRRAAWRILLSIEEKEEYRGRDIADLARYYRESRIEDELDRDCKKIIRLIDSFLDRSDESKESLAFYLKMKGDYHRYLAEFKIGDERKEAVDSAIKAYEAAHEAITESDLSLTDPIRLGLALNSSVFYYEIMNSSEEACERAKKAIADLAGLGEESNKDSTLIMQLHRENLTLWTSDAQEQIPS